MQEYSELETAKFVKPINKIFYGQLEQSYCIDVNCRSVFADYDLSLCMRVQRFFGGRKVDDADFTRIQAISAL